MAPYGQNLRELAAEHLLRMSVSYLYKFDVMSDGGSHISLADVCAQMPLGIVGL